MEIKFNCNYLQRLMISSMLKPVEEVAGATTVECWCWEDLTLSCKRYSEMVCLCFCWANAEFCSFCWDWGENLLSILVLPNTGDKNCNFELSSPMVVTLTSISQSSLDSVRWEPVDELSSLELNWDLWLFILGTGGSCGFTESQMLCVSLCRLRSQFRRNTFLHWLHS